MFEHTTHSNSTTRYLRLILVPLVVTLVAGALTVTPSPASSTGSSYSYPVKPFESEHPVRGNFGDPRTLFKVPPTTEGALSGGGSFQFHFGIDISAPDGTAVYPVVSGTVSNLSAHWVAVSCGDGRAFQYWHIGPKVRVGDHVTAYETVLGRILRGAKHVHFTEFQDGRIVNPLQAGHLTPYTDTSAPRIRSISIRKSVAALELPNFLRGSVDFVVDAYDTPNRPVPGIWRDMPVAPARITWRLENLRGRAVVGERVAIDFRSGIPASSAFWSYYARGSFQNMSVFGKHYSYMQPGRYLYRLSRSPFDTTKLKDGVYDLVVTATDIRGNSTTDSLRFTVHNRPGWIGS